YADNKNLKDGKPEDLRKVFGTAVQKAGGADAIYQQMNTMSGNFNLFGNENLSLLKAPWVKGEGFKAMSWLWLIPLVSGITSFFVSFISMRFSKRSMPQNQPGQGCTNNMMLVYMPAFSTFIAFSVPGAVGVYWVFSNMISMVQTVILNKIYDPGKARAEAEAELAERRRQKAEDKKRLAMARQREEAEARKAEQALERQREESREMNKKKKKKAPSNDNQAVAADNGAENGTTDAVDTQPVTDTDDTDASAE
ncbi:MAG: YidC/Oxa1 family membrane protein insertase, partial [Clostridia bacterium]|nr:YidC/Oxa1 family membrane protein insertase [Clostridia bacterium]